jgi:hypothetical protein
VASTLHAIESAVLHSDSRPKQPTSSMSVDTVCESSEHFESTPDFIISVIVEANTV